MKHIIIKSIRMVNFQAFKDKTIEFNDSENSIRGMNATGKTTVMRAVNYLLFGKDQFGRTDFEIKPLTKTGEPEHNVDSEVTAELISGNETITLKKVYHEKWVKPRGQAEVVFNGHEALYFFNGVPVTMREYNSKVESICPEQLFKLLTNPLYFPSLPWQEQRKLLFEICGNVSDEEIASQHKAWISLLNTINGHKTMDEYKREIASEKRKIKDELEKIPARIDEAQRALPQEEDWQNLNNVIASLRDQTQSIDKEISDLSAGIEKENEKCLHNQNLLNTKKRELQNLEYDIQAKAGQKYIELTHSRAMDSEKLKSLKEIKERLERSSKNLEQDKQQLLNEREELLKEWHDLSKQKEVFFLEEEFVCPTCKRPLDDTDIEEKKKELTAKWNEERAKKLEKNVNKGKEVAILIQQITHNITAANQKQTDLSIEIKVIEDKLKTGEEELAKAKEESENWKQLTTEDEKHKTLTHAISQLTLSIGEPKKVDISEQVAKKESIQGKLEDCLQRLNNKTFIDQGNKRIAELKKGQKDLAQKLADLERVEYHIQGFIKAKIEAIEGIINSKFSDVHFKLFDKQVNGEEVETCQITYQGIPWGDLNNAARITTGIDVIKTFMDHYGIYPPVFSDNCEALNKMPEIKSQTIRLYVTNDPQLIIN